MNRNELLSKHSHLYMPYAVKDKQNKFRPVVDEEGAEEAMDEHAEQVAISFIEWSYGNHWQNYDSTERWINQQQGNKVVTTKELFKIYKAANP